MSPLTVDDELWSAVGDPTRRRILDLLMSGEGTATSLAEQLPVTRQGVTKHLAVLERAGLVHGTTTGRERRYRVDAARVTAAAEQLSSASSVWDRRMLRIQSIAEAIHHTPKGRLTVPNITHRVAVSGASPTAVYDALTTLEGLSGWWTRETTGDPTLGGTVAFRFHGGGGCDAEVVEAVPGERVVWRIVTGPQEWVDTTVAWEIRPAGDWTVLLFAHRGWRESGEFMSHCSTKWASFLMSLKALLETGAGAPAPDDVPIGDWR